MKGKKIAHYKVIDQLGEGGMGVVYKAEDTKLKRTVALKFLPLQGISTKQEKSRFLREAQAAAALNHANIATVYANEEDGDQSFIVMEYIEGKSLKEVIEQGPMKMSKVIRLAGQIANALQAAHEKGVVHRDIKSSNVMVTDRGLVKVMDFGLAKLTGSSLLTRQGTTLGTAAYMSPEQARGEDVDYRTDIWSFGVLLYEMVSGLMPFQGDYEQALVYSIMNEEPEPMTAVRTGVPMALERIVAKCLTKAPTARYQNATEIPVDLQAVDVSSGSSSSIVRSAVSVSNLGARKPSKWRRAITWAGIVMALAAVGFGAWRYGVTSQTSKVRRLSVATQSKVSFWQNPSVAVSADGSNIVYVGERNGERILFLRAIDKFDAGAIQGTQNATSPFFSLDGQWVGFYADGKLKKVSVFGGVPVVLADVGAFLGASWHSSGELYYCGRQPGSKTYGIMKVASDGSGQPSVVVPDAGGAGKVRFYWPAMLPDGKAMMFTAIPAGVSDPDSGRIEIFEFETRARKTVLEGGVCAKYSPTGHVVAAWSGGLLAAPFDVAQRQVTGPTMPVLENLHLEFGYVPNFTLSDDGALAFIHAPNQQPAPHLVELRPDGSSELIAKEGRQYGSLSVSPDQGVAATVENGDESQIWIVDSGGDAMQLEGVSGSCSDPVWASDGESLAYASRRAGEWGVYTMNVVKKSAEQELISGSTRLLPTSWNPAGKSLLYCQAHPDSSMDIWSVDFSKKQVRTKPFLTTGAAEKQAVFSPDGNWVAYTSNQTGEDEIYVTSYSEPEASVMVSNEGGEHPAWNAAGDKLYYRRGDSFVAAGMSTDGDSLRVEESMVVFDAPTSGNGFAVSGSGDRFFVISESGFYAADRINVVLNWFEELNQQVPSGKTLLGFKF